MITETSGASGAIFKPHRKSMLSQAEIDARLKRYAATLDASDLWPEIPARVFRRAQAELARIVAVVLGGTRPVHLDLPAGVDAHAIGVAASAAGVGPLLGLWCETGGLVAQPPVAEILARHLDEGRKRATRLHQELDRLLAAFAARRIDVIVLKGTHTGRSYFTEPGTR